MTAGDGFFGRRNSDDAPIEVSPENVPVGAPFGGAGIADEVLMQEGYEITSITYDADGVPVSAVVVWFDGSAGVLTVTSIDSEFFMVNAYTVTHATSGKTLTQPAVTRNTDGQPTTIPQRTIL